MKNRFIPLFLLLFFTILHSQIGVNTQRPMRAFHVDASSNNPKTTDPTEAEQKDDFVINEKGVVSIGTTTPSPYSALEIESDKGLRLPQLTNAERDALDALSSSGTITKKNGLTIYNITTKCINYWALTEWVEICGVSANNNCTPVSGTPILTANSNLVVNNTTILTVTGVTNATSYEWYVNGNLLTSTTSPTLSYTPTSSDYISITVIAKGCNNSTTGESNAITGNQCTPVSGTPILTANSNLVVNNTTILTVTGVTNATSYEWYVNGNFVTSTTSPTLSYTPTSSDYISITVIAKGCNNSTTGESNAITGNQCTPVSGTPILTANSNLVVNNTTILTVTGVTNATSYEWYVNGNFVTSTTSPTLSYTPTSSDYISITVIAKGCNNSTTGESNAITGNQCTPVSGTPILTANSNLVVNNTTILTVTGVTNATSYEWYVNGNFVTSTTSPTLSYTPTSSDYISITVIAKGCNNSTTGESNAITGNQCTPVSGTPILTANSNLVVNNTTILTVTGVTNATSYEWYVNGNFVTSTTSPTLSYTPTSSDYISITVIAKGCNNSTTGESNAITGNQCTPVSGTPIITANSNLVVNNTTIFTASGVSNATSYVWYVNGTPVQDGASNTFPYTPTSTNFVTISVIAKGCNNSQTTSASYTGTPTGGCIPMTGTLSINPANSSANTGTSVTFTASGVSNANNYTWYINGTQVQSGSSNTYNFFVNTSQATNTITVKASDNCGNTQTATTNLNSSPEAFTCRSIGRYLIAGSQCDRYVYCVQPGVKYYYSCTANNGGGKFNPATQKCTTNPFTCPY